MTKFANVQNELFMQNADLINEKIGRFRTGYIFTPSDFYDVVNSPSVVSRILAQMVREGSIRKLSKGKYDKPKQSAFGIMPPSQDWLVREFLFNGKKAIGYISGTRAFAQMGLTTQISSTYQIGSNTYRRAVTRGDNKITFILQPNIITKSNTPLLQLLDAMRFIRQIPGTTPNTAVGILLNKIKALHADEKKNLARLALAYTSSVRALTGALLDGTGDDTSSLYKSLNMATVHKLGISEDALPNRKKWRIV